MTAPARSGLAGLLDDVGELRRYQRPFFILLGIFTLFYFSELANFSLSIDDETALFRRDAAIWASQERWLTYLVEQFVVPPPIFPFFPIFVFGLLACLGYLIVVKAHRYGIEDAATLLAFILFGAFPILYFNVDFSAIIVALGIGLVLSCFSVLAFSRALEAWAGGQRTRRDIVGLFVLQVVAGAAAVGTYQSLILLIAVGCCGVFLLHDLRGAAATPRLFSIVHVYLAASLLASLVLSYLVSRGFQWVLGAEPAYVGGFLQFERIIQDPLGVLGKLFREYWMVYGGKRAVYGFRYITFPLLLALGIVALALRVPQRRAGRVVFVVLYALGMTLLPFALNIVTGGELPYRTYLAVPYVFWFFAAGAVLCPVPLVRRLAIALVVVVSLQCLYTFSMFQAEKRLVLDHDKQLAGQVYERIVGAVPDFDRTKTYRVDFYGAHEFDSVYPEINASTLAGSFFEWDGGNPYRIWMFMKALGYSNFTPIDDTVRKALLPAIQKMPVWPAQGSVAVVDEVVVVRLGIHPGSTHQKLVD